MLSLLAFAQFLIAIDYNIVYVAYPISDKNSGSPDHNCNGSSTPMPSRSAACCCWAVAPPTGSGAAVLAALKPLPRDQRDTTRPPFGLPGAATATAGSTAQVIALVQGPDNGWTHPAVLFALVAAIVLLTGFVATQRHGMAPLMPLTLLSNRGVTTAMAASFVFMGSVGAQYYILTVYLQDVRGYGALATGLTFAIPTLATLIGTRIAQFLLTRNGNRTTHMTGLLLGAVGMTALGLGLTGDFLALLPGLVITSIGQGITFTATYVTASSGVEPGRQGVASAIAGALIVAALLPTRTRAKVY